MQNEYRLQVSFTTIIVDKLKDYSRIIYHVALRTGSIQPEHHVMAHARHIVFSSLCPQYEMVSASQCPGAIEFIIAQTRTTETAVRCIRANLFANHD